MKDIEEILKNHPNLEAILQGTISGKFSEWPLVRKELENFIHICEARVQSAETRAVIATNLCRTVQGDLNRSKGQYAALHDALRKAIMESDHE